MDYKIQKPTDNQEEPLTSSPEIEAIESWTFLGDDSTNIHSSPIVDDENLPNQQDEDAKVSPKTSRSSSGCLSENLLSVINHADGDVSDGISVISDCDSLNDRHSPIPAPKIHSKKSFPNDIDNSSDATHNTSLTLRTENFDQHTLVERSDDHEVEALTGNDDDFPPYFVWNPTNIILLGLIVGAAAILSSRCWLMNSSSESIMPELSSLDQRIKDLESENFALKVEVSRLVDLHHAGHDHFHKNEKTDEKRPVKVKEVWSGEDETPIHIPKYPVKEDYCNEEYLQSDDLFASYNAKKCEIVETTEEVDHKAELKSKQMRDEDNDFKQFEARKKKNFTKDDVAPLKRQKFAESKAKNGNNANHNLNSDSDEIVRNEKFLKLQEERQKLYDEAEEKYSKRQQRLNKRQERDKKHRDGLREQNALHKNKDTDSDWYDKMMKQREELRAIGLNTGATKQLNKENWYIERANQREKVRGKHEKQAKTKQCR